MSASTPLTLELAEYEIIRFLYQREQRHGKPVALIELVVRHRRTHEQVGYRFKGVHPEFLPPVRMNQPIQIVNNEGRQWESPRRLQVSLEEGDGFDTVMFWAGDVESIT